MDAHIQQLLDMAQRLDDEARLLRATAQLLLTSAAAPVLPPSPAAPLPAQMPPVKQPPLAKFKGPPPVLLMAAAAAQQAQAPGQLPKPKPPPPPSSPRPSCASETVAPRLPSVAVQRAAALDAIVKLKAKHAALPGWVTIIVDSTAAAAQGLAWPSSCRKLRSAPRPLHLPSEAAGFFAS